MARPPRPPLRLRMARVPVWARPILRRLLRDASCGKSKKCTRGEKSFPREPTTLVSRVCSHKGDLGLFGAKAKVV